MEGYFHTKTRGTKFPLTRKLRGAGWPYVLTGRPQCECAQLCLSLSVWQLACTRKCRYVCSPRASATVSYKINQTELLHLNTTALVIVSIITIWSLWQLMKQSSHDLPVYVTEPCLHFEMWFVLMDVFNRRRLQRSTAQCHLVMKTFKIERYPIIYTRVCMLLILQCTC